MCEELVIVRYNRHVLPRINKVKEFNTFALL